MRALLAEDDAILADALGTNLKSAGFEVEVADNGAVAEYLLTKQAFDVGIIDIGLPLVDGLTVVQRVRAVKPGLPLLILTALDGLHNRVAGLNAGADDYLTKPFDFPELEARIRAVLRRSQGAAAQPAAPADLPHLEQLGPYRIGHAIGRGTMGVVYLAHDAEGRQVALKTLALANEFDAVGLCVFVLADACADFVAARVDGDETAALADGRAGGVHG